MLRYSMSRKISAVLHFSKELVQELTNDLLPIEAAGFYPMKIDITLEVAGRLGPSGALIPIKDLHNILQASVQECDRLQSSLATLSHQLWGAILAALAARPAGEHSPDLTVSFLELGFENGTRFKVHPQDPTLTLKYPLSFQHAVEFDLGPNGERLHHGHDAQVEVAVAADATTATQFLTHSKGRLDMAMAATGEMIVRAIAESLNEFEFQQKLSNVSLKETQKNRFSATFDRPQSSEHK